MTCTVSFAVSQKISLIQHLLGQLLTKSDELTCKVDDVSKVVEDVKCAFQSLGGDVEVLESIKSLVASQERDNEVEKEQKECDQEEQLKAIQSALEEKKETAEDVRKFSHPCGGHGWKRVAYFDFRRDDTECPAGFRTGEGNKPHVCVSTYAPALSPSGDLLCSVFFSFPPPGPYSSVCGRIAAYQLGTDHQAFAPQGPNVNHLYLTGVSLTHGGDLTEVTDIATHIWSFAVGSTQDQTSTPVNHRCPCDMGGSPPSFVGEDYFCESGNTEVLPTGMATFFPGNLLWDGLGCIPFSTCCSRIGHPYFVKHLGTATTDNIDLRTCTTIFLDFARTALELIEIYVK